MESPGVGKYSFILLIPVTLSYACSIFPSYCSVKSPTQCNECEYKVRTGRNFNYHILDTAGIRIVYEEDIRTCQGGSGHIVCARYLLVGSKYCCPPNISFLAILAVGEKQQVYRQNIPEMIIIKYSRDCGWPRRP